jgi:hypothetical protein
MSGRGRSNALKKAGLLSWSTNPVDVGVRKLLVNAGAPDRPEFIH